METQKDSLQVWPDELRQRAQEDFGHGPWIISLATVQITNGQPRPAARSVVCRSIESDGALTFTCDLRSAKIDQLAANPHVALIFWLASIRIQYRISGISAILPAADPARRRHWEQMSPASRMMFFWPVPLKPLEPSDARAAQKIPVAARSGMPANFSVVRVMPTEVDELSLNSTPHSRILWQRTAAGWTRNAVNP